MGWDCVLGCFMVSCDKVWVVLLVKVDTMVYVLCLCSQRSVLVGVVTGDFWDFCDMIFEFTHLRLVGLCECFDCFCVAC